MMEYELMQTANIDIKDAVLFSASSYIKSQKLQHNFAGTSNSRPFLFTRLPRLWNFPWHSSISHIKKLYIICSFLTALASFITESATSVLHRPLSSPHLCEVSHRLHLSQKHYCTSFIHPSSTTSVISACSLVKLMFRHFLSYTPIIIPVTISVLIIHNHITVSFI